MYIRHTNPLFNWIVDAGYEETVTNFFISHFAILNILKSQNCRLHFLIYCDTVSYPYIPPLKNPTLARLSNSAKKLKTTSSKFSIFFNQRLKLALISSFKNIGVDSAYIGSTRLSEYPYATEIWWSVFRCDRSLSRLIFCQPSKLLVPAP